MSQIISKLSRHVVSLAAVALLVVAMGGTWTRAASASPAASASATPALGRGAAKPSDPDAPPAKKASHKDLTGKLNLNAANEEQLQLLPTVGPAKAERIVAWRSKNGGFKRVADLRRVKGFGYKTFKKLEPFLDIKGDTTLAAR